MSSWLRNPTTTPSAVAQSGDRERTAETHAASPKKHLVNKLPTPKVRVVFMGTPKLSASLLQALIKEQYTVVGIVTKPDKPVGRKNEIVSSPVKNVALQSNIPLFQPEKLDEEALRIIGDWKPELIIVAAYGKILPETLLGTPKFGCVNFHPSLLPKWRGASPIQNALLAGETKTGVTIMLMDKGMDTGNILSQTTIAIDPDDTADSLTEKVIETGTELLLDTLPHWVERHLTPSKQDDKGATLCQLIEREDGRIIWTDDAESIYNRFRALTPWPGIFTYWKKDGERLRLKLLKIASQKNSPQISQPLGEVFEIGEKIGVQTTSGVIFLEEVQLEGKTPLPIRDFLRGNGSLLGSLLE